uniref:NAD(P)(+)--arginine ADP-ribosyltransferase n=2 Tax=Haptolina brevifila TaxID=156173 RepID=A0A7S2FL88_9EUKA
MGKLDLERHLRGCFAAFWRKADLKYRFDALRSALLAFQDTNEPRSFIDVKRYMQMWLSDVTNFVPFKTPLQLEEENHAAKKAIEQEWDATAAELELKGHQPDEIEVRRKRWLAKLEHERVEAAKAQKEQDELTTFESLLATILVASQPPDQQIVGKSRTNEIDEKLTELCKALQDSFHSPPGLFLSRTLLDEPCIVQPDRVAAKAATTAKAKMNLSEIINMWPIVRRIIVGHPDERKRRKLITDEQDTQSLTHLLRKGLPIEAAPFGYSIIYLACAQGNQEVIEFVVHEGADLHALSKDHVLPIEVAAAMGEVNVVNQLLALGSYFGAAMHYAAAAGQMRVVQTLLDHGMDPCIAYISPGSMQEKTPLELAVLHEHAPVLNVLSRHLRKREDHDKVHDRFAEERLADMDMGRKSKEAKQKKEAEMQIMIGSRTLFDRERDRLPIHLQNSKVLQNLTSSSMEHGSGDTADGDASKDASNDNESHALEDFAHVRDYIEGVTTVKPTKLDAEDALGFTHLAYAALYNDADTARRLLELGSKHTMRNRHGFSAVLWAHWQGSHDFLKVLGEKVDQSATRLDGTDREAFEMLMHSSESSVDPVVTRLLKITPSDSSAASTAMASGDRSKRRHGSLSSKEMLEFEKEQLAQRQVASITDIQGIDQLLSMRVFDPSDIPQMSLEAYLLWLGTESEYAGLYPDKGMFKHNMPGFVNSCKACTMNVIAANAMPAGVTPIDIFALHLYTRVELYHHINRAFRSAPKNDRRVEAELALAQRLWRPVVWYIATAQSHLKPKPGLYFRGVNRLYSFLDLSSYRPQQMIKFPSFSSTTSDLRVAGRFMYSDRDISSMEGVIFKIWAKTPAAIDWCSYALREKEHLFNPETRFKVLAWYKATTANLWRGMRMEQRGHSSFLLSCDNVVDSVPLPLLQESTKEGQERELRAQLGDHQFLLIELEEVLLTEEEQLEMEEKKEQERFEALDGLKQAIADTADLLQSAVEGKAAGIAMVEADAAAVAAGGEAGELKVLNAVEAERVKVELQQEAKLKASRELLTQALLRAERLYYDSPMQIKAFVGQAQKRLRDLKRALMHIEVSKMSDTLQQFEPLLHEISRLSLEEVDEMRSARGGSNLSPVGGKGPSGGLLAVSAAGDLGYGGSSVGGGVVHDFEERLEQLKKLEDIVASNPSMSDEREAMQQVVEEVRERVRLCIDARRQRLKLPAERERFQAVLNEMKSMMKAYEASYQAAFGIIMKEPNARASLEEISNLARIANLKADGIFALELQRQKQQQAADGQDQQPSADQCYVTVRVDSVTGKPTFYQKTVDQSELFFHAAVVRQKVTRLLNERFESNITSTARLKQHTRIAEKAMLRDDEPGSVDRCCDVVRDMFKAATIREVCEAVKSMCEWEAIQIVRIKDRYDDAGKSEGGWRDCMINFVVKDMPHAHICELQVVHIAMLTSREGLHAHSIYNHTRNAIELQDLEDKLSKQTRANFG